MTLFFDRARFGRLWRAHLAESWRMYAWFVGIAAMIDLICLVISFSADASRSFSVFQFDGQIGWYTIGLFASGVIFAGRYFKNLADPGSALIALMRPASHFEKWLLTFLVVSVLFPLTYTLAYSLLNFPAVQLAKALYVSPAACDNCAKGFTHDFSFYIPFLTKGMQKNVADATQPFIKLQVFVMLVLWSVQALVLGGTVFFKRSPVLRTVLTLFLLSVVLLWLGTSPQMGTFWSRSDDELIPYNMFESVLSLVHWVGLPLLLWAVIFFHIKEREVS